MLQDKKKQEITGKNLKKKMMSFALLSGFITIHALAAESDTSELSPGQREAWDKMLFGGLGIMLAMVIFILFLYLRSHRKREKNPSDI